ncbi:hypothetical protein [Nocardiopsis coralliicola]
MGADLIPDPDDMRPAPWWVRLSRWLNGARACAVSDCIGLAESGLYCAEHIDAIRELRAREGPRLCARDGCPEPRHGGAVHGELCRAHGDEALIRGCWGRGRWDTGARR